MVGAAALVLCFVVACGSSESEEGGSQAEGWLVVQEQHAALMALRDEAAAIRAEIDAGVEGDENTGLSPEEALLQVERRLAAKDEEIADSADEFSGDLVAGNDDSSGELECQHRRAVGHHPGYLAEVSLQVGQQLWVVDLQELQEAGAPIFGPKPHRDFPPSLETAGFDYSPPRCT